MAAVPPDAPHLQLTWEADTDLEPAAAELPFGLEVLRFALSEDSCTTLRADGTCWRWSRHA
jgi:hypothetical protein